MLLTPSPIHAWLALAEGQITLLKQLETWCRPSIQTPRRVRRAVELAALPTTLSLGLLADKTR